MTRLDDTEPAVRKIPKSERNRWPIGDTTFLERQKWVIITVAATVAIFGLARLVVTTPLPGIVFFIGAGTVLLLATAIGFVAAGVVDVVGRVM